MGLSRQEARKLARIAAKDNVARIKRAEEYARQDPHVPRPKVKVNVDPRFAGWRRILLRSTAGFCAWLMNVTTRLVVGKAKA